MNPARRAEDTTTLRRLLHLIERWRWIIWILFLAVMAVGFDFKTPASQFRALQADSERQDAEIASLRVLARALAIGQCLDRPRRETQLMGLPCEELLRQGGSR